MTVPNPSVVGAIGNTVWGVGWLNVGTVWAGWLGADAKQFGADIAGVGEGCWLVCDIGGKLEEQLNKRRQPVPAGEFVVACVRINADSTPHQQLLR